MINTAENKSSTSLSSSATLSVNHTLKQISLPSCEPSLSLLLLSCYDWLSQRTLPLFFWGDRPYQFDNSEFTNIGQKHWVQTKPCYLLIWFDFSLVYNRGSVDCQKRKSLNHRYRYVGGTWFKIKFQVVEGFTIHINSVDRKKKQCFSLHIIFCLSSVCQAV